MATGLVAADVSTGYTIKGPTLSACGIDMVKTNLLIIGASQKATFRLLGQMSFLEGLFGANYQIVSWPD